VRGNFHQIEQVVMNLLTNACQALTDSGQTITIATLFMPESESVIVEVRDEGIGISEEDMPHITDPFFTTKRDKGGAGLGLSVCFRIVENHGGTLVFKSEQKKGTTARITLPAGGSD
jgi:polar amino acid transport system substrate-binding protein